MGDERGASGNGVASQFGGGGSFKPNQKMVEA
jgi:hypothetical protein